MRDRVIRGGMMHQSEKIPRAFIPHKDTKFAIDDAEYDLVEGIIYLCPRPLPVGWACELERQGVGRCL